MATAKPKNPSSKQYEQWKFSLKNTLEDGEGLACFKTFLIQHEKENLQNPGKYTRYSDFWEDCHEFKKDPTNQAANEIYETYLKSGAPKKINLAGDDDIVPDMKEALKTLNVSSDNWSEFFDRALDGMRQYLDEGGCCNAYEVWKSQLKVEKKNKGITCRLM